MTGEQALLAAVLADPGEDTPRLVYADWLDEYGGGNVPCGLCDGVGGRTNPTGGYREFGGTHPAWESCHRCSGTGRVGDGRRAEFVRVQCELARVAGCGRCGDCHGHLSRVNPGCPRHALRRRERELLAAVGPWFAAALPAGWTVTLPWAAWNTHADELLSRHPITEVRFTDLPAPERAGANDVARRVVFYRLPGAGGPAAEVGFDELAARGYDYDRCRDLIARRFLAARWKRVETWHLPPEPAQERERYTPDPGAIRRWRERADPNPGAVPTDGLRDARVRVGGYFELNAPSPGPEHPGG